MTDRPVDPLVIKFPIQVVHPSGADLDTLVTPIVHSYLTFEMSWAKQRGLLAVPKPFFPGKHFTKTNMAFVLMPFNKDFDDVYSMCIKPCVEKHSLKCRRADEIFEPGSIIESIWQNINEALIIIADLTTKNANVFYEVGMAHTLGKEVILLTRDLDDVPFDLRHLRVIRYDWTPRGVETLGVSLNANLIAIIEREFPFGRRATI